MNNNSIHLSGLNGLRAVAAISVVVSHTMQNIFGDWGVTSIQIPFLFDGVTMFFVISGFLITYLLIKENEQTETVKIGSFYMRRILRIWPIYYLYIFLSIIILILVGLQTDIIYSKLWYYIFFAANIPFISVSGIWVLVHLWSIGVEEQFYLFWPWLVKISKKYILPVACMVGGIWAILKFGSWLLYSNDSWIYKFFNVTRFHCMMVGAIGAILYSRNTVWFRKITTNRAVQIIAWTFFLLSGLYANYIPAILRAEFYAVVSLLLIMGQVGGGVFINLENRPFDFVGKISYGVYVWHPLVIFLLSSTFLKSGMTGNTITYLLIYISTIVITILIAWLSYTFYERPFLRLKSRFTIVRSQSYIQQ